MVRFAMLFALIVSALACLGQQTNETTLKRNTVFGEYSVEGPVYSVNYDRIIARPGNVSYTIRAGLSILADQVAIPLGFNLFTGRGNHHPEFGLTMTPTIEQKTYTNGEKDNDKNLYVFPAVGYRYQRSQGGLFARVAVGPSIYLDPAEGDFWNMNPRTRFSASLGLGFTF